MSTYYEATKFEVLVDLDQALAEKVARAVEAIEGLSGNSGAADHIRQLGKLNSLLQELATENVFVFVGGYFERSIASEDGEYEDARWTSYKAVERAIGLIEFSPEEGRHHTREVRVGMSADTQFERMSQHEAAGHSVDWGNVVPF